MQAALLNGRPVDAQQPVVHLNDRGWLYGDGLFETMLLTGGRVRFLQDHIERLQLGCERLGIAVPATQLLQQELAQLCGSNQHAVVRLTVTRGRAERGYRPPEHAEPTRVWQLFSAPPSIGTGIEVRWCETRLSRNPLLAGIKHCNRLEQVLAQAEWCNAEIAEGLMLDTEGELVCATASNVFLVFDGVLVTPDLRYSGIAGVMRKNLLRLARDLRIEQEQRAVRPEEVSDAQELFVCNAVRGIQPVVTLAGQRWAVGAVARQLTTALEQC